MKHKISVRMEKRGLGGSPWYRPIGQWVKYVLQSEGVQVPCEVNLLLTDDAGIQAINRAHRELDKPTDVLSFPMFDLTPGQPPVEEEERADPETGLFPLGDVVISLERVQAQAMAYGHRFERELGFLVVHSILHLLGYDHLDDGPMQKAMRTKEKEILEKLALF